MADGFHRADGGQVSLQIGCEGVALIGYGTIRKSWMTPSALSLLPAFVASVRD